MRLLSGESLLSKYPATEAAFQLLIDSISWVNEHEMTRLPDLSHRTIVSQRSLKPAQRPDTAHTTRLKIHGRRYVQNSTFALTSVPVDMRLNNGRR